MGKKVRSSNFELLRILSMMMVIALHQNGMVNALAVLTPGSTNYYLAHAAEAISICSVDCFVLLSGYFMITQKETKLKKCLSLLVDVAFWGLLGYAMAFILWGERVGIKAIIIAILPYIKGGRWFVRDYVILMLLAPFLNTCLTRISKQSYRILLVVQLLLFSVWPSFLPNPPIDDYGYGFVHFIFLYSIAGYLRLHATKQRKIITYIGVFIGSVVLIFLSNLAGMAYAFAYNYVFVISAAVSLLLLFRGMQIQAKWINWLAACSFDAFVIHTTGFFASLIYIRLFHLDTLMQGNSLWYLLGLLICPPVFYLFCAVLSQIKQAVFRCTVDRWINRLPLYSYRVD